MEKYTSALVRVYKVSKGNGHYRLNSSSFFLPTDGLYVCVVHSHSPPYRWGYVCGALSLASPQMGLYVWCTLSFFLLLFSTPVA